MRCVCLTWPAPTSSLVKPSTHWCSGRGAPRGCVRTDAGPVMRVVVALDSFKGSLGSLAAGEAAAAGVRAADPDASVVVVPVADGGEGTLEAVGDDARWVEVDTVDALGRALRAPYVIGRDGTAVVEAARTVGLAMVDPVDDTVPPRASS